MPCACEVCIRLSRIEYERIQLVKQKLETHRQHFIDEIKRSAYGIIQATTDGNFHTEIVVMEKAINNYRSTMQ